jgi:hypothetical protein
MIGEKRQCPVNRRSEATQTPRVLQRRLSKHERLRATPEEAPEAEGIPETKV